MDFSSSFTGLSDVEKVFKNLPRSSQRKVYMKALRAGGKVIKEDATNNIRQVSDKYTGVLSQKSSIAVYNGKKYRGNFRVLVQVRKGLINTKVNKSNPVRVGLYASVLEYGKKNQRPRSWARKAIREGKVKSVEALRKEFYIRLPEAVQDAKR